jgi:N-methylhydantoinase B
MIGAIEAILARYPRDRLAPGDIFLANDPYNGGGTHLSDLNLVAPVFVGGEVVAFVANIAHHADVGGTVPGSESALCATIYQEGLRIPVVRVLRGAEPDQDILDLILLNSRTPEERMGDLQAQFAANRVGVERVAGLFARYPRDVVDTCIEGFLAATGQRFAAAVSALADGTYAAEEFLDEGDGGQPARLALRLTVAGGRLCFDFVESAPQLALSSRNVPRKAVLAVVYAVAKSLLDPDVPPNAGYYGSIEVLTKPGTLLDPLPPAAVGTRAITCGVLGDLIVAMGQALGRRGMADSGPHHLVIFSGSDPRHGGVFVDYETVAGGMGARGGRDGMDAVRVHASGAANLPVEALENAYPLRVERYALRRGSGGAGWFRGGQGAVRNYRVLADSVTVSLSSERQKRPARGVAGGGDGATGVFLLNPGTQGERRLPSAAVDLPLARGDVLRVMTPGGGFGAPDREGGP